MKIFPTLSSMFFQYASRLGALTALFHQTQMLLSVSSPRNAPSLSPHPKFLSSESVLHWPKLVISKVRTVRAVWQMVENVTSQAPSVRIVRAVWEMVKDVTSQAPSGGTVRAVWEMVEDLISQTPSVGTTVWEMVKDLTSQTSSVITVRAVWD